MMRVFSISAVRLGPVIRVRLVGISANDAKNSEKVGNIFSLGTIATWCSGKRLACRNLPEALEQMTVPVSATPENDSSMVIDADS